MDIQELRWLLVAINAAPFSNTEEARYKAAALIETAKRLDEADKKAQAEAE